MDYVSVNTVQYITVAFLGLVSGMCGVRLARDFMEAYHDEDGGVKHAFLKIKNRLFASVIAICATGLVAYFKKFY